MAHILIVFADPNMTEVPAVVCDGAGYTCAFAQELEAGDKLTAERFDLALLVSLKPIPLARALRAVNPSIPMVAVVNEMAPSEATAARQAGINSLIFRPYSIQTLRKALADELGDQHGGDVIDFHRRHQ